MPAYGAIFSGVDVRDYKMVCTNQNIEFPEVLDSVLQPHVEFYKKNLKGGVVVPGRIS